MSGDDPNVRSATEDDRVQYSLQTLLGLTACVAMACSLFFSVSDTASTLALMAVTMLLPAVIATVLIYGRGYQRTFCIGAMFPAGTMLVCTSLMLLIHSISAYQNTVSSWNEFVVEVGPYYRPYVAFTLVACLTVGLATVGVRWYVEWGRRK